jgi:quercetin dioxygenase-like cupin family protein
MKDGFRQIPRIRVIAIGLCLGVLTAVAQSYPPAYPRKNAKEILQNDRVNVWDVMWPKGQPTAMHEHPFDQFSITLRGGTIRATRLGGPPGKEHVSTVGSVTLTPKGTIHTEEGLSDVPQHKIILEVKPSAAADDVRGTLPAEGAVKVFENGRLAAWDFTWKPQQVVSRQAENFATVTVFLDGGTIHSVTGQGEAKNTVRSPGEVVYSVVGTEALTEQAVSGSPRAVIVELK